ncbi:hypothetical protein B5807_00923 [Epicoccum nigrum]|uniref:Uncharacterized protein n=1 Tax=Epicoccum nigrum TaxID=105696 RepID=A0A1Y2MCD6_EPING|nr:hypothetical protein B5807_00923 [Epicoccum nigrum]
MEIDTPLSSSHPIWGQPAQREPQQPQHSQARDPIRQSIQSNTSQPPVATPRSPVDRHDATPYKGPATIPSQMSPQAGQPQSEYTVGSSIRNDQSYSTVNSRPDAYKYPRDPRDVYFDAIERLQTQTSQNTSALAAQARTQVEAASLVGQIENSLRRELQSQLQRQDQELRRMSDMVNQLVGELAECRQTMMGLAHEAHVARTEGVRRPSEAVQPGYQDDALELMAQRIGEISHRTTDLETLRDHVAILGGKVHRLETETAATRQPQPHPQYAAQQQPTHLPQTAHPAPPHPSQPSAYQTPAHPTSISQPTPTHETPAPAMVPESAHRHEAVPGQTGWATVNAGVKRVFESGTGSPRQGSSVPGSPKRPRLVNGESQDGSSMSKPPEPSHMLPSQTQPIVTSQPLTQPGSYPGPSQGVYPGTQPAAHPAAHQGLPPPQPHLHYGVHDSPSDQGWHPESQRMVESRPARGRGSRGGRGPGSRGGRVRKSMQGQHHSVGTPEWERDQWSAVPNSQASPGVYEGHPAHPTRSVVRRGGGGASLSRVGSFSGDRPNEWTPEIGPRTVYHIQDSPIEIKKTRSKPIRNEDGILVRKDGRPDRRSQSSAANLRKVHARKEEQQRDTERLSTPSRLHPTSTEPNSASPSSHDHQLDPNVTDSHDYAHQVFNEDQDHTAHPRSQVARSGIPPIKIKKEHSERREVPETQSATNGDVEMGDDAAPMNRNGRDESQARSGEAAHVQGQGESQKDVTEESRVQIPETQATDDSATLAAESVETG